MTNILQHGLGAASTENFSHPFVARLSSPSVEFLKVKLPTEPP